MSRRSVVRHEQYIVHSNVMNTVSLKAFFIPAPSSFTDQISCPEYKIGIGLKYYIADVQDQLDTIYCHADVAELRLEIQNAINC